MRFYQKLDLADQTRAPHLKNYTRQSTFALTLNPKIQATLL